MTSKIKCPFCGEELQKTYEPEEYWCSNYSCGKPHPFNLQGTKELWQALIQTKQDLEQSEKCCSAWETQALDYKAETIALSGKLEIARKALKELWQATHYDTDGYLGKTIQQALEQIEHKE